MTAIEIGKWVAQPAGYKAFIPRKFPPSGGFTIPPALRSKNEMAARLLGKLDGVTALLPNVDFFLLMAIRKDAASSSQIEGTQATLQDAIAANIVPMGDLPPDVDDILRYIKALQFGLRRTAGEGFPVSLRFIRELHRELTLNARATQFADPGRFRQSQNWIGGTRPDNAEFVPPPPEAMKAALSDLEDFIHSKDEYPVLIKSALLHAQFETIHPFLDGNGRTGRMLITFYLWKEGFLERPVLYLSSYFKRHRKLYYQRLSGYHNGMVLEWLDFFLDGVAAIAAEAIETVQKINALQINDLYKLHALGKRAAQSAVRVLPKLYEQPIVNNALVCEWTGFSRQGADMVIKRFVDLGILHPQDESKSYAQLYVYKNYLDIFTE